MRELTKSVTTYTWAMMVFGLQQTFNLLSPNAWTQNGRATQGLRNVTEATTDELGDTLKATFRVGDNLQRGMVDLMFTVFTLGMFDANGWTRRGADAVQQTVDAAGRAARGCATTSCSDTGRSWTDGEERRPRARDARAERAAADQPRRDQTSPDQPSPGWGPMPR